MYLTTASIALNQFTHIYLNISNFHEKLPLLPRCNIHKLRSGLTRLRKEQTSTSYTGMYQGLKEHHSIFVQDDLKIMLISKYFFVKMKMIVRIIYALVYQYNIYALVYQYNMYALVSSLSI